MFKFIGAVLVIISGTGIGFKASENLILQNVQLKKIKRVTHYSTWRNKIQ